MPAPTGSAIPADTDVYVHFDGWGRFATPDWTFGRMEAARVQMETRQRYRVTFLEDWPRGSKGDIVLVPKWAVTPQNARAHAQPPERDVPCNDDVRIS